MTAVLAVLMLAACSTPQDPANAGTRPDDGGVSNNTQSESDESSPVAIAIPTLPTIPATPAIAPPAREPSSEDPMKGVEELIVVGSGGSVILEGATVAAALAGQAGQVQTASENARFSTAVALFGMLLQESEFKGAGNYRLVEELASNALGKDEHGERKEFLQLVELAGNL